MLALALAALALAPPVPGAVERPFSYAGDPFAAGHHRGVDLAAAPGARVRAACCGRVTFAGRAGPTGRAVTIRCGRFSVTHLPLATLATEAGATLPEGAPIGTVARSATHEGLHLGVRAAGDPLGYVDPAPLLRATPRPAPPAGPGTPVRRTAPRPPHTAPAPPRAAPAPAPVGAPHPGSSPLAPWPAWAGLALLLAGAAGARTARGARADRARTARADRARTARADRARAAGTVRP